MTNKEATYILDHITVSPECDVPRNKCYEAIYIAIKAIEKQIPKKPIFQDVIDGDPETGEPILVGIAEFCPCCDEWLNDTNKIVNYCPKCGQMIDCGGQDNDK